MAASDEFKALLRAGKFADALTLALSESIEIEITTWVSSETEEFSPSRRLRTRINLVEGEIENELGRELISNGVYANLQQFHLEQVQAGRQTLLRNLASLQEIFGGLNNTLSQLRQAQGQNSQALPESEQ